MTNESGIFKKNREDYLERISSLDLSAAAVILGLQSQDHCFILPFFHRKLIISDDNIIDGNGNELTYNELVIVSKYLLLCPKTQHRDSDWVSFRDFKRTSHFLNVNFFASGTERSIEEHFSGRIKNLRLACESLGGFPSDTDYPYDLTMQFQALPNISLLLLFNDKDEVYPAKSTVLFQKKAEYYLDPESLSMTSALLAEYLKIHPSD